MNVDWAKILPVISSITIIIMIALLRNYSRHFAAVVAVMPANITLGLWIVYSSADDPKAELGEFSRAMIINIIPTVIFIGFAWYAIRAGWAFWPMLLGAYGLWMVLIALIFMVKGA